MASRAPLPARSALPAHVTARPDSREATQAPWLTAQRPEPLRPAQHRQTGRAAEPGWMTGLDGLRAVAVLAVLLFHADLGILPGGFLGVDVFFVISGFLITSLLLRERALTGRIDLPAFWRRRARRLLPALFLLLAGVVGFTAVAVPDAVVRLRADALAAFAYVTNWYLVFDHQSYFATIGRPSLLRHLWSLAVEEQFYLAWPIVLAVALLLVRRGGAFVVTVLIAIASVAWTLVLFDPDADPSRVYYGTDTRLYGLLAGAALAFVWPRPRRISSARRQAVGRRVHWSDVLGIAGLAVLGWAFAAMDEFDPALYPWGLLGVALVSTGVIAMVTHPAGRLGRLLDTAPLRWVGRRSYGIYLWHWPIFALTRPGLDVPLSPVATLALRAGLTLAIAAVSYRFVEAPVRAGALGRLGPRLRAAMAGAAWRRVGAAMAATAVLAGFAALGVRVGGAEPADPSGIVPAASFQSVVTAVTSSVPEASPSPPAAPEASIDPTRRPSESPQPVATGRPSARPGLVVPGSAAPAVVASTPTPVPMSSGAPAASLPPVTASDPMPTADGTLSGVQAGHSPAPSMPTVPTSAPASTPPDPAPVPTAVVPVIVPSVAPSTAAPSAPPAVRRGTAFAIGDSVMLGAAAELGGALGKVEVDAVVGRQVSSAITILDDRRTTNRLPDVVIVHLGDNGPVTTRQVTQLFDVLADVPHVFVLTVRIPDDFEAHNNRLLTELARDRANITVIDWYTASEGHPELFWNDGEHLRPEGAVVYAALIAATLQQQGVLAP